MPNRLTAETSPYLRQHADNPVDWHPWGEEAFALARDTDRPVLLSVGYAACHWCHVMAHESFEDETTAALMNELFVNVKVDREERPDVDAIYMQAVQAMTGHGGWPMTVFLTPDGAPFFGGTYYPPQDRHGMPSFARVLRSIADAYRTQRGSVEATARSMRDLYERQRAPQDATGAVTPATLERAYRSIAGRYDPRNGGFEGAPKFPQPMSLDFLLRYWRRTGTAGALEMVRHSFQRMARGGIYDQVGGGFHRYAVDAIWLVPHFEKMLYDNALLARLGVHLWQATGDLETRRIVEETLEWLSREMTSPEGGFYSSLDADSEGEEGKFYVWSAAEVDELLGEDAPLVRAYWGITEGGNFEGRNIPNVAADPAAIARRLDVDERRLAEAVAQAREKLYLVRAKRVWPGRDEKILAGWNGLMLRAVALAARVFEDHGARELALRNAEFLRRRLVSDDGRVTRVYMEGVSRISGFLEDHTAVALAFLEMHELTLDLRWLRDARRIAQATVQWFWDDALGGFYDTASDAEQLVTRPRDVTDNAIPSGNSMAAELLLRIAMLYDDESMRARAGQLLASHAEPMSRFGSAFGHLLGAAGMAVNGQVEVALIGDAADERTRELHAELARHYLPTLLLAAAEPDGAEDVALLANRPLLNDHPTAYVCRGYICNRPVNAPEELAEQLEEAATTRQE